MPVVLEEEINDAFGPYVVRWHMEPPPKGVTYIVTKETWDDRYLVRDIYEIRYPTASDIKEAKRTGIV